MLAAHARVMHTPANDVAGCMHARPATVVCERASEALRRLRRYSTGVTASAAVAVPSPPPRRPAPLPRHQRARSSVVPRCCPRDAWLFVTRLPELPQRTARRRCRVAATTALLAPYSEVRQLTVDRASLKLKVEADADPRAFAGTGVFAPLLAAAGRLPLRSLTVGLLGAEVISLAVAPACRALETLRSLRLWRLLSAAKWEAPVRATLAALSARLVDLFIDIEVATHEAQYPAGGALEIALADVPPALALRCFSFVGELSAGDAAALATWDPGLTSRKLTLNQRKAGVDALRWPALPHLTRLEQLGNLEDTELLLTDRPLTAVTIVPGAAVHGGTFPDPLL